jgi:preprotein translocase subunit SecG
MFYEVLMVVYLIVALMLIGMVLIQQGKGADMGASFGSGGSNTVFGSGGSSNFMTRTTAILATLFFAVSLILGNQTADKEKAVDQWQDMEVPVVQSQESVQPVDTDVPVTAAPASDVPVAEQAPQQQTPAEESDDVPN